MTLADPQPLPISASPVDTMNSCCSLAQALFFLAKGQAIKPEAAFRATTRAADLPEALAARETLVGLLATGEIKHVGRLVVMDSDYEVDSTGKTHRREVELGSQNFVAASGHWHIDNVEFWNGTLTLPFIEGLSPEPGSGIDGPWLVLRDIQIDVADMEAAAKSTGRAISSPKSRGGAPVRKDWNAFWYEVIANFYENGTPLDTDADWTSLNKALYSQLTDFDDSALRRQTRQLREHLKQRGLIHPPPTPPSRV